MEALSGLRVGRRVGARRVATGASPAAAAAAAEAAAAFEWRRGGEVTVGFARAEDVRASRTLFASVLGGGDAPGQQEPAEGAGGGEGGQQ